MNNNNTYAFYGSLRPGMYNFAGFKQRYQEDIEVVAEEKEIKGYKLYSLGAYPYAIKTGNDDDAMKVSVIKAKNRAETNIHGMEIGAGYEYDEVEIDGEKCGIYLFPAGYAREERLVPHGDWVKFKTETN